MHSPFVAMIREILERGVKGGVFRNGVDAVQLYISIAALAYFYLGNNYTLSAIFGRDLKAQERRGDERLAHMTELVLGYLRKGLNDAGHAIRQRRAPRRRDDHAVGGLGDRAARRARRHPACSASAARWARR